MALDPRTLAIPGVQDGLRRQAAADAYGYGSIAARFAPSDPGSILARRLPGVFGPDSTSTSPYAGLSGQPLADAQTARQIQNNNNVLTLRRQGLGLAENPDTQLQLQQAQQTYTQRMLAGKLGSFGNVFGNTAAPADDEEDEEKDNDDF